MKSRITAARLEVEAPPRGTNSLDVSFDGRRIWSIDLQGTEKDHTVRLAWPESLVPHLTGRTRVTISDSVSGTELATEEVAFDDSETRTVVADDDGAPLVVNKWGRLGASLEGLGGETRELIVTRAAELVRVLSEFGLRPFVVGGTLLGGVRDGALLPHDDDADIAYLSQHELPADVAIEAFEVGHRLAELGYEIQRHSATHMQLLFRDDAGTVLHYIDVFAAFFTPDGHINQPFHVRGPLRADQMIPFGNVTIEGVNFPAPADVDAWLTLNYDARWREPIPGFVLETPEQTRRLFDGWFGGFNFQREFWGDTYRSPAGADADARWEAGAAWIAAQNLRSDALLDLGSGSGRVAKRLASTGRRVVACDYSRDALRLASEAGLETAHVNLYRLNSLTVPRELGIAGPFDVVANHVFEQIGHLGRANAYRLSRMALRSGGGAVATVYGAPASGVTDQDPTGWHLEKHELRAEARGYGLVAEFTSLEPGPGEEARAPYGVRFTLGHDPYKRKDLSVKQRLRQLFLRGRSPGTGEELESLRERVRELESELVDIRRDNLRVAELIDLAEQTLTPGETAHREPHSGSRGGAADAGAAGTAGTAADAGAAGPAGTAADAGDTAAQGKRPTR